MARLGIDKNPSTLNAEDAKQYYTEIIEAANQRIMLQNPKKTTIQNIKGLDNHYESKTFIEDLKID